MTEKSLLALIRRMDEMEQRLSAKIDVLWNFRLKILGGAMVIGFVGSSLTALLLEFIRR